VCWQFAVHSWNPNQEGKNYWGLEATMDVYGYNLEPQQQSMSSIWIYIIGGGKSKITGFSVGWHVSNKFSKYVLPLVQNNCPKMDFIYTCFNV
jgi:hypothetical protein